MSYQGLELDAEVELIRGLIPLGPMHMQELLDEGGTIARREWYALEGDHTCLWPSSGS